MKNLIVKGLEAISVGKYHTTLYNKSGKNYKASVFGGLVSIAIFLGIGYLTIISVIDIFQRNHYNLNQSSTKIDAIMFDSSNGTLTTEKNCTFNENCKEFRVKDITRILDPADIRLIF